LWRYVILYNRKKEAYRELVRKSQEWAQVTDVDDAPSVEHKNSAELTDQRQNKEPDKTDLLIMKDIERAMSQDKLYKDAELSIDSLADKLGAKRHYVSGAINRCTKKNFNTFVNEYRIKEAVNLLSSADAKSFTIENIAWETGFADRQNFYRVFKKITGLTPAEFKRNATN
jgi:YesN/AraC family two-component response regulator